jgi:hypothetical protein
MSMPLIFKKKKDFFMALDKKRLAMVHARVVCLVAHRPRGRVDVVTTMVEAGAGGEGASRCRVGTVPVVPTSAQQLVLLGAALASLACCRRWGREGLGGRLATTAAVLAATGGSAAAASPPPSPSIAADVRSSLAASGRRCGPTLLQAGRPRAEPLTPDVFNFS